MQSYRCVVCQEEITSKEHSYSTKFFNMALTGNIKKNKNKSIEATIAKTVAAFMNTECGGYLLIGVKDDKTILGLRMTTKF